jgi:UDP-N-acetylglucosamine 2-epimerase (non-hydrolysing)
MRTVALIVGTRPECIKMAPLYFELQRSQRLRPVLVATAQHRQMLDQALAVFGLRPDVDLNLMQPGQGLPDLTARVLTSVHSWLSMARPDAVLVQGDTTTVLGSSLAAFYANIPIGHVEAGLRTDDMRAPYPEEMNRRLTAPLVRWNFCPTGQARENLLSEAIDDASCTVTGNTVVDALLWTRERLQGRTVDADVVARLGMPADFARRYLGDPKAKWLLVTGHRRESFGQGFEQICRALQQLTERNPDLGVLYPVHLNPLVQEPVHRLLGQNRRIALIPPASYEDFVWLMDRATVILTDSGGVQEEAPSLGKPVLVLRNATERVEAIAAGTCTLVGTDPARICQETERLLNDPAEYLRRSRLQNPYGDGTAAARIRAVLERDLA